MKSSLHVLGVVAILAGAQAAFKRASEHNEVREQAMRELDKLREAGRLGTK